MQYNAFQDGDVNIDPVRWINFIKDIQQEQKRRALNGIQLVHDT